MLELSIDVPNPNVREIPIRGRRSERDEGFERGRERDLDRDQPALQTDHASRPMTFLIAGAADFIGSHMTERLLSRVARGAGGFPVARTSARSRNGSPWSSGSRRGEP